MAQLPRYSLVMSLEAALQAFYDRHGFGDTIGARPRTVPVYTGCLLVPLPNIETRHRYLRYHDLHHLITGYSVGRIGEGQISAWELGSGSMRESLTLGVMNLIALSTGWVLDRHRMWDAYCRGCRSENLYSSRMRARVDAGEWQNVEALRAAVLEIRGSRTPRPSQRAAFALLVGASLFIHTAIAIPAVVARTLTDLRRGRRLRDALRPRPRTDLY